MTNLYFSSAELKKIENILKINDMRTLIILLIALTSFGDAFANVSLPAIFSDNMVLQRNSEVKIWGWAKAGEEISLKASWAEEEVKTRTSNQAYWEITLKTPDIRGAQEIRIKGFNELVLQNVLLGEVWLVSGQSNMEWSADSGITNAEEAITGAENKNIRFFTVTHRSAEYPQQDLGGSWVASTPETMRSFSAVAYFFGKKLNEELDVPVGLINASWGGTPAEVWMPEEAFENNNNLTEAASLLRESQWWPHKPAKLFNAMISPLVPFKLAGFLWYQGESNTANADRYEDIFGELIKSWRQKWGEELPFYYAQIAPYNYGEGYAGVKVRDAQRRVLSLPKTGMVMTSDIGDIQDIHPRNKLDVGLRFAKLALTEVYDVSVKGVYAPVFERLEKDGRELKIHFAHAEGLQADPSNTKSQFELAGADGKFYPATSKIRNGVVILRSREVKDPKYARFSWGNMSTSNLFNAAGLPASSFTTED